MKIQSHASAVSAFAREGVKPAHAHRAAKTGGDVETPALNETSAKKAAPPGLERVLARLESIGEADRTPGQNQAMGRIARNLARYQENQAVAPLPDPVAPEPSEPEVAAGEQTPDA